MPLEDLLAREWNISPTDAQSTNDTSATFTLRRLLSPDSSAPVPRLYPISAGPRLPLSVSLSIAKGELVNGAIVVYQKYAATLQLAQ